MENDYGVVFDYISTSVSKFSFDIVSIQINTRRLFYTDYNKQLLFIVPLMFLTPVTITILVFPFDTVDGGTFVPTDDRRYNADTTKTVPLFWPIVC